LFVGARNILGHLGCGVPGAAGRFGWVDCDLAKWGLLGARIFTLVERENLSSRSPQDYVFWSGWSVWAIVAIADFFLAQAIGRMVHVPLRGSPTVVN
jgi:hypothetical protein